MEDGRAVERPKCRCAQYCDAGYDSEGIAGLFTSGGRRVVDGEGARLNSREEVREHLRALSKRIRLNAATDLRDGIEVAQGESGHLARRGVGD
ncbi:hypothetical protein [Streptomyces aquilus]|uniref:hypothetical protein n=1 Tax=Streptomyces aquilus TaxID=2548456 RepID=UPI0036C1E220